MVYTLLTVNNDLHSLEVNFSPGHDTSLTSVVALICLFNAADLQVAIIHDLKSNYKKRKKRTKVRDCEDYILNKTVEQKKRDLISLL